MHIVVCIKQVPDSAQIRVHPVTNTIMRQGVPAIVNPYDLFALEEALRLKDKFGGSTYKRARDQYMTQVYNYFSLPPALPRFCAAARETSLALAEAPKGKLDEVAQVELPKLELVFLGYFDEYEAYRAEAAAWDAEYLATYGEPYRHRWMVPAPVDPNAPADLPDPAALPSASASDTGANNEG